MDLVYIIKYYHHINVVSGNHQHQSLMSPPKYLKIIIIKKVALIINWVPINTSLSISFLFLSLKFWGKYSYTIQRDIIVKRILFEMQKYCTEERKQIYTTA